MRLSGEPDMLYVQENQKLEKKNLVSKLNSF